MPQTFLNYAFIDGQNVHLGTRESGWIPDYKKFRDYLKTRYNVGKAFYFIGYKTEQESLYKSLKESGYELVFKPTYITNGEIKGNCDAELVLQCMIEYNNFNKAVIVSGDGDFYCLVKYLKDNAKLRMVLVPNKESFSELLPKAAGGQFCSMNDLKHTEIAFELLG
jgi:uncharacterized LabA/DUF88 family protein